MARPELLVKPLHGEPFHFALDKDVISIGLTDVETFNDIKTNVGPIGEQDERFDVVPYWRNGASIATLRLYLPR